MTGKEKLTQGINRHLNNMNEQQLRIMLLLAMELDKGNDQKEETN